MNPFTNRLLMAALCASLAACAGPDPIRYSDIEASPQMTINSKDDDGRIPYRYAAAADWHDYDRVLLEPVAIYRGSDHQFAGMSEEDKDDLARTMQSEFARKLQHRFSLVRNPGPHTLRIRLTLTGATTNTAVLSTFSHLDLAGNLYNGVQAMRGGEGAVSGSVMYSVEIFDAATNRLLNAYVTKQYPGAMNIGSSFGSLAAAKTGIEKGADTLVAELR
jgi:hypothetical protein